MGGLAASIFAFVLVIHPATQAVGTTAEGQRPSQQSAAVEPKSLPAGTPAPAETTSSPADLPDHITPHRADLSAGPGVGSEFKAPQNAAPRALRTPPEARRNEGSRAWIILVVAEHSAAGFDAYSTRHVLTTGTRRELDPLMRPFAGSAAIYPVMQAGPVVLDYLGHRWMRSQRTWARRIWWLPQAAATAGFLWSGAHNMSLPPTPLPAGR